MLFNDEPPIRCGQSIDRRKGLANQPMRRDIGQSIRAEMESGGLGLLGLVKATAPLPDRGILRWTGIHPPYPYLACGKGADHRSLARKHRTAFYTVLWRKRHKNRPGNLLTERVP
jgi:hypothetical protein